MTNEQAIKWLKDYIQNTPFQMEQYERAFEMAIKALSQEPTDIVSRGAFEQVMCERDIAIEQLHELGYELGQKIEPCDDVVSRQAVLNAIEHEDKWLLASKGHNGLTEIAFSGLKARVDALPPVTQKSGKWILLDECSNSGYYCSNCQKKLVKEGWSQTVKKIKFCPNCGAIMEIDANE